MLRTAPRYWAPMLVAVAVFALPGSGASGSSPTGFSAAASGALGPHAAALAVAPDGEIAVVDSHSSLVKTFTNGGALVGAWGTGGEFVRPAAVAFAASGDAYVGDATRVRRMSPAGAFLATWGGAGSAPGQFAEIGGLAVTAAGDVLVADRGNDRLQRFSATGSWLETWVAGTVADPRGVAVGPDGSVYVADLGHHRILRLSSAGQPIGAWPVADPYGVATAPDGTVYVADTDGHRVLAFTPEGGPAGQIPGLELPRGVATDCRGRVYVTDNSATRLQRFGSAFAPPPCATPPTPPVPAAPAVAPPPPPQRAVLGSLTPQLGKTLIASKVSGTVLVRIPGGAKSQKLGKTRRLFPIGSRFDTTRGRAKLELATAPADFAAYGKVQSGEFYDGVFSVFQSKTETLTELALTGEPPACGTRALSAAKRKKRRVWGNATGKFRTSGSNGAATVRGTVWLTEDRCDGTLVKVDRGTVDVRDFRRNKDVTVTAGKQYLAGAPCRSDRRFTITLRTPLGTAIRSARVVVNGRPARVTIGSRVTAVVDLRGLPKGTVTVRITAVTTTGARLTGVRRYMTCAGKGPSRNKTGLK
jgi:DNA-binding beta-propeller fold protein YncE